MTTLFTREERTLLGHHVEAQTKASTTYSRDSQVTLQYKVLKLISLIKTDKLRPDASRAERLSLMTASSDALPEPGQEMEEVAPDLETSDDASYDCSEPEAFVEAPEMPANAPRERNEVAVASEATYWWVHCFTGVAHFQVDEADERLACGRCISSNLVSAEMSDLMGNGSLLCKQCEAAYKRDRQ